MHLRIISGILLVFPIVDIALAAPVLVQEKRQPYADVADIPEYPLTVLGKRGEIEEVGGKYIENWFALPKEESAAAHGSWSSAPSEAAHESTDAPAPNPGLPTESKDELAGTQPQPQPLLSPYTTYIHPDNELLGAHGSQPSTGPSNPSTESNQDYKLVAEEPPSPTGSDFVIVDKPPSSPALSTNPNSESMSANSSLRRRI